MHGAAAVYPGGEFSLCALRRRSTRLWLAAAGLASLASMYVTPAIGAFRLPAVTSGSPAETVPPLDLPVFRFPGFAVPKLHKPHALPAVRHVQPAAPVQRQRVVHRPASTRRVPVVTNTVTLEQPTKTTSAKPKDPFAGAPVVDNTVGAPPSPLSPAAQPSTPAPAPADTTTPPADAATPPADTTYTQPATEPVRTLQAFADTDTSSTTTVDATVSAPDPGTVDAPDTVAAPSAPVAPPAPETITEPAPPPLSVPTVDVSTPAPVVTEPTLDVPDAPAIDTTSATTSIETQTSSTSADPTPTTSGATGATTLGGSAGATSSGSGGSADAATTSATAPAADATAPASADLPSTDPAAVPGSGPSPPAAWTVSLDSSSHAVSIAASATDLVVTVDGAASSRALDSVTSLTVVGGAGDDTFTIGGTMPVAVTLDGGAGDDTLSGPAADSTWNVTGAGAGTVGGVSFDGFEHLVGAADNQDTFVFSPSGSVAGGIDGGAGGFDTLVVSGGSYANVTYTISGPDSGTVARDADVIAYAGLEPIGDQTGSTLENFTGASGETITIADSGAGSFSVTPSVGEGVNFTGVSAIRTLTIDITAGHQTVHLQSIDPAFTGTIVVHGGSGVSNAFQAPDLAGTFHLTGINSGTYQADGGPLVTFDGVQSLAGAPTAADTFDFDGGSVAGTITDGAGTLTVQVAGFVQVSGDYDFTQTTKTIPFAGASSGTATNANVLEVSGTTGTGFVGVQPLGNPVGLQGTLTGFGLAVVTDGTHAWSLFQGTIHNPTVVALVDLFTAPTDLTVQVNSTSSGTFLNTHANPLAAGPVSLDFTTGVIAATATFSLTLSQFVHLSGQFTVGLGSPTTVSVATGLDGSNHATAAPGLSEITNTDCSGNALGRSADWSTICNLPVSALTLAASNVTVFVGYAGGPIDSITDEASLPAGSIGLFASGVSVGLVLMAARTTGIAGVDALGLRFYSLKGHADDIALVGIPDLTLKATGITVQVNGGKGWATDPQAQAPAVDFATSFPGGYTIATGGEPISVDAAGPVVGASADNVLFEIGSFVHVSGGFNFYKGPDQAVDVKTGLESETERTALFPGVDTSADDPGTFAVTADGSEIWNLPVKTVDFGLSNLTIFVGYADSTLSLGSDGVLGQDDLAAANAIGVFLGQADLGLTLMTPVLPPTLATLAADRLQFLALRADADTLALLGVPGLTATATGVEVRVNRGTAAAWPTGPTGARPYVDFAASFAGGAYQIPTDSSGDTVGIDFAQPTIGASADHILFQILSFVYIAGGFSIDQGATEAVDVKTGLTLNSTATRDALFGATTTYTDTDPGDFAVSTDGSMIWNLPVQTLSIGISHASLFVGYADDGLSAGTDGILDQADVLAKHGIGLLLSDVTIGIVLFRAEPVASAPELTAAQLKFYSVLADAHTVALLGVPDLTLTATDLQVRVNQGTTTAAWPGVAQQVPPPVVDFASSFPAVAPSTDPGYVVRTDTSGNTTVKLAFDQPLIGASANQVVFAVSNFVYIAGGFSFDKGPELKVNVKTELSAAQAQDSGIFAGIGKVADAAAANGDLKVSNDYSMIFNLPVQQLEIGLTRASIFAGYSTGVPVKPDGTIDVNALAASGAIGLEIDNVTLGMVMLRAPPIALAPELTAQRLSFFALKATADSMAFLGIPDFNISADGVEVRVNQGSATTWPGAATGGPKPVIDFPSSFPADGGFLARTDTAGDTVKIAWDQPLVGVSSDKVLFKIAQFVYVTGAFSFDLGPVQLMDVKTGLNLSTVQRDLQFPTVPVAATKADANGGLAVTANGDEIWNLRVQTDVIGLSGVNVFVGYSDPWNDADVLANGLTLTQLTSANAIGVFLHDVSMGLLLGHALPESTGDTPAIPVAPLNEANLKFYSLRVDASLIDLLGIPQFTLTSNNLEVRLNQGKASWLPDSLPLTGVAPPPVIDFVSSFGADGLAVRTDTSGVHPPVKLDFTTPEIGVSADNVLLRISDFVYVTGGFNFDKGPVEYVDVKTNLPLIEAQTLFADLNEFDSDPCPDGSCHTFGWGNTVDGPVLWNLPVDLLDFGLSNVDVFVGYTDSLDAAAADGRLTKDELEAAHAIGLFFGNVNLGMTLMRAEQVIGKLGEPAEGVNGGNLSFTSLKVSADNVALLGIPDLVLFATNIQVRLNMGSASGDWVAISAGGTAPPPPNIDFKRSFGPSGFQVQTDTSHLHPVSLDYTDPEIGASADQVVLQISSFVYVSGGFSFDKGPQQKVAVRTGLSELQAEEFIHTMPNSDTAPTDGSLAITSDGSMIWNLPVTTLQIGLRNVTVFAGYAHDLTNALADGDLSQADLTAASAIGVYLHNVNLGLVLMDELPVNVLFGTLNEARLRFFALQASADNLALLGVPSITLEATGASVSVNQGTFEEGLWPAITGETPPVVDWTASFPATSGYQVPTDTSGDFELLSFEQPLIAGGAQHFTIQISSFVYLTGSIYFQKGPVIDAPLTGGVLGNPADILSSLGLPQSILHDLGLTDASMETMTIGASHVEAFVGVNGPYWQDTNHNGVIDRDPVTGQIVDSEIDHSAIGLVMDDVNFGLFVGMPTLIPDDPIKYIALKASAKTVRFVGVDGLTASADDVDIELNISTPTLEGLPVLPVVNFSALPGGFYGVKTGAKNQDGSDLTINMDFSTALIRARSSWIQLDLFGVVTLQGSIAFNLGPKADVVLTDGTHQTLTTMTIGAANVSAFVGYNGPYITDKAGHTNPNAVGLAISQLNLGLLIGIDTDLTSPGVFIAGSLDVKSFGTVGFPPNTIDLQGTLSVKLNLGASLLSGGTAINFQSSFPAANGKPAGFAVDTGDPASPVVLDFSGFLVDIDIAGSLTVLNVFRIQGALVFQTDASSLKVFVAGEMTIGPDIGAGSSILDITALGVLILNGQGLAADVDVSLSLNASVALTLDVAARVIVNTTGADQSIAIPDRLLNVLGLYRNGSVGGAPAGSSTLATLLQARLTSCGDSTHCYVVHGGAPSIFTSPGHPDLSSVPILLGTQSGTVHYEAPGSYIVVVMSGSFDFLGFVTANGQAAISIRSNAFEMVGSLSFTIGPLSFSASGDIGIYPDGIQVHIQVTLDVNMLSLFDLNASGTLDIDTTGSNDYFRLSLSGSISVLSIISLSGGITIVVDHSAWTITIPDTNKLTATFGPLSIMGWGTISSNGHFDLHFHGGITLGTSDTGITGTADISASFDGSHFHFSAGGGFSANFEGVSLFGVSVTGTVDGTLGQSVSFDVTVTGTGVFLETIYTVVRMTEEAAVDAGYAIYNFLGEIGCDISNFFDPGSCENWVDATVPSSAYLPETPSFTLHIATFALPSTLTNVVTPPPPPNLASLNSSTGVLTLNVGSLGSNRNVGKSGGSPLQDETYEIAYLGASSGGGSKLRVLAFGVNETYDGVRSVFGDFGDGVDSLTVDSGVPVPVEAHGGNGNDTLSYLGSGSAKLYGDAGNDTLALGPSTAGNPTTVVLDGGADNDSLTNDSASGATLNGGDGNDSIKGGSGNDTISGGNGNDTISGRGGADTINGDAGDDLIREAIGDLVSGDSVNGGTSVSTVGDTLQITGTAASDSFTVGVSGTTITVSSGGHSVAVNAMEVITILGAGGGDTYTVSGALDLEGLKQLNLDLSSGAVDVNGDGTTDFTSHPGADSITMNLSSGNDSATLTTTNGTGGTVQPGAPIPVSGVGTTVSWSGHYRLQAINSSVTDNDVLTINALDGNDTLNGATVTGILWRHVNLNGGAGDDKIAGTPDDDTIDSGTGNDIVSGGAGTDTFIDASGTDELLEIGAFDFGLWHNLFVEGTAAVTGAGETRAVSSFSSATAEDPSVFEQAVLLGSTAGERNVFTIGSATASITVNGIVHSALSPWAGAATLNGYGGNDEYIVETAGLSNGSVTILEDGAAGGSDALTVKGTDNADSGNVATSGPATSAITLNGSTVTVSTQIETIGVFLRGGNDSFTVRSLNLPLTLDGGANDDSLTVGFNGLVSGVGAPLTVNGGLGSDVLTVDDSADSGGRSATLTSTTLTGLAPATITYTIDTLIVDLGTAGDTFTILSTAAGTSTTVNGGPGGNVFDLGTGNVNAIAGAVTVNGPGSLFVDETGDASSVGNDGTLTASTITGLGLGAGVTYNGIGFVSVSLGAGSTTFNVRSTSTETLVRTGDGADTVNVSADAPANLGVLSLLAGHLAVDGQGGGDNLFLSDFGNAAGGSGRLSSTDVTGFGTAGVTYVNVASLQLQLGSGNDRLDVVSTHLLAVTTVRAGPGDDLVNVSSDGGLTAGIAGHLIVDGQAGTDTLHVSDAGDAAPSFGTLTSTDLIGLGTAGITYAGLETVTIDLGSAGDSFTVLSTFGGAVTTLNGNGGADTFVAGAPLLDGIAGLLVVDGGAGADSLTAIDSGDATPNSGVLTSTMLTGLGMGAGISYANLEQLTVNLGSGDDSFLVVSTHAAPTNVNGGPGRDAITVNPSVYGTPNTIAGLLTLDGQGDGDTYTIDTFGNGNSEIDVLDSAGGPDTLIVNGTPVADQFLFRTNLVAALASGVERIVYNGAIESLQVNGVAGDDKFAFDDTSAPATVSGGAGNDTVQVGQLFGAPELFVTPVSLTATTRGDLSNGVDFSTTLNGDDGQDRFQIFHNAAPLATNGGAGDDTFVIRTFAGRDQNTTVSAGGGSDLVAYVQNAPLTIDGGDGFDTVLVIGTELDDTFVITSTSISGAGINVTYANVERVTVDGDAGNDHFVVQSTAAGVETRIYGDLGSDTIDVVSTHDVLGPLFVEGGTDPNAKPAIPAPVLLPGESVGPLPGLANPNLNVVEANQVDTLNVTDTATGAETGTLTPTTITGLGMPAGITYTGIESLNVALGSGDDTFTVVDTNGGATTVATGAGNDAVNVYAISGPTAILGGAGNDTITVGSPSGTLSGIASLLAVDGGADTDALVVNDGGATADELGTLTQNSLTGLELVGSAHVFSVAPHGGPFTITVAGLTTAPLAANATAAAVQAALQTLLFPAATCGSLGTSRCAQSVFVWALGGEYLIGFQGELANAAPALTSTVTDLPRPGGIDYASIESLTVALGSGNDRFNVRGTSATTTVSTGAGDDVVYVSDAADLGSLPAAAATAGGDLGALNAQLLYGTVTVDDLSFHGSLAQIAGALTIDEGTGSNTLGVSDRADTASRTATITATQILGLAPAPIAYAATGGDLAGEGFWTRIADVGLFGRGITIYGGSGGNTFTIASVLASDVLPAPFATTLTSLFAGEGADTVTITGANGPARSLVVDGQGGNDTINGAGATLPLVVFGGPGSDAIAGGSASDLLFGDDGRAYFLRPAGAAGFDVVLGGAPAAADLVDPRTLAVTAADASFLSRDVAVSRTTGSADTIAAGGGDDLVFGGGAGDTIDAGDGNDLVFGDFGWVGAEFVSIDAPGGDDVIAAGNGDDIVLGGFGNDTIAGGAGDDDLIGGSNVAGASDGNDTIDGGAGNDAIAGDNASILHRGDSLSLRVRTLTAPTIYSVDASGTILANVGAAAIDPTGVAERTIVLYDGSGDDNLAGGAGDDVIFGQGGNDTIQGDGSTALPLGTSAEGAADGADYVEGGAGNDLIFGDLGQDDLIGGSSSLYLAPGSGRPDGSDVIYGGAGAHTGLNDMGDGSHSADADVMLGDNGNVYRLVGADGKFLSYNYEPGVIPRAVVLLDYSPFGDAGYVSCNPLSPAVCTAVTTDARRNTNAGGADFLYGESGDDVIHGETGADTIFGGPADDQLYGESGADWISGGTGDDGILGDDGLLLASRNGTAEPLNGLAATTPVTLSMDEHGDDWGNDRDNTTVTVNVYGELHYTADLEPFFVGNNDIVYGGLGNDFLHGGAGDDAMSGAEALPLYYDNARNPLGVIAAYYAAANVLGYNAATATFRWFNPYDPFEKIMVAPGVDFLLNFVSATSFGATIASVVDDGKDVLFGDEGNDWLVGGTNEDHLYGGYGDDVLQADDNLDSTRVDVAVTYTSLCSTVTSFSTDSHTTSDLCRQLSQIASAVARSTRYDPTDALDAWGEDVIRAIGDGFTPDQAGTLLRLVQKLKPGYDPNANDIVDPRGSLPSFADIAFGGAGRDVLIGNTASDRLIDWNESFNTYVLPWEHVGDLNAAGDPEEDTAAFLSDLSLADGADPTRPEVPTWWPAPVRNGEPYGELGLVLRGDADWHAQFGRSRQDVDVEGAPDLGSLQLTVARTPSISASRFERFDDITEALVARIMIRGQITAAEQAALSPANAAALTCLIRSGLVSQVGGAFVATDSLLLLTGLADPPAIADVSPPAQTPTTTPVTVRGCGDAGDTIKLYDNGVLIGTTVVGADGTWSLTVNLGLGTHYLSATQTVNLPPHAGLTSDCGNTVRVTVTAPRKH